MVVLSYEFADIRFCELLYISEAILGYNMILFGYGLILIGSIFQVHEPSVLLVAILINFGVKKQVPQVSFKIVAGDLMLVSSYEFADILFFESLIISESILDYVSQEFTLHSPRAYLPIYLITCSSPHRTSKDGDILHSLGHLLLTLGADFTSHGLLFKDAIYQFLGFSSQGSNSQSIFSLIS